MLHIQVFRRLLFCAILVYGIGGATVVPSSKLRRKLERYCFRVPRHNPPPQWRNARTEFCQNYVFQKRKDAHNAVTSCV